MSEDLINEMCGEKIMRRDEDKHIIKKTTGSRETNDHMDCDEAQQMYIYVCMQEFKKRGGKHDQ